MGGWFPSEFAACNAERLSAEGKLKHCSEYGNLPKPTADEAAEARARHRADGCPPPDGVDPDAWGRQRERYGDPHSESDLAEDGDHHNEFDATRLSDGQLRDSLAQTVDPESKRLLEAEADRRGLS
ncbi:MAG TPA: hypothetical protein VFW09_17830 [Solirubrobacteraceae bacterium]|nr:hypothetical protein [Solirubrobacteraceae bacterium]